MNIMIDNITSYNVVHQLRRQRRLPGEDAGPEDRRHPAQGREVAAEEGDDVACAIVCYNRS